MSATTVALIVALLSVLLNAAHSHRHASGGVIPAFARSSVGGDSIVGWRTRAATPARLVFEWQLDALATALDTLAGALDAKPTPRRAFRLARLAYKRAESLLEVYSPTIAHALNGPLENDDGDAPPRPLGSPAAFQSILTSIGPDATHAARDSAGAIAIAMRDQVRHLRGQTRYLDVAELPVLEGARAELARVTTLGLAGFDLDDSNDAVREAAAALDGVREVAIAEAAGDTNVARGAAREVPHELAREVSRDAWLRIARTLRDASGYLRAHPDFARLDRLELITAFANPAAGAIAQARAPLLAHAYPLRRAWRATAATVFEPRALDPTAFAPDYAPAATPALIALGARLFNDTRLSGAGDRSCATCHQPQRAFTDGRARPLLIGSTHGAVQAHARNTPTLLDVAYQPLYFADERALTLEDQIGAVLASQTEMGSSTERAAEQLSRDTAMRAALAHVLPNRAGAGPDGRAVRIALAAYLRSLDSFDSRFDRAVRGDRSALTARERFGFTLFMGKARCGTCHFAPLFSGVMPPEFTTSEPEIIGVLERAVLRRARLDPDSGRAGIDHLPEHLFAFKVPTLRNVAATAPYMHNGAYATLDDVVSFYDHGGGAGIGAHIPYTTLASSRLHLTAGERGAIVAFLRALTDTAAKANPQYLALQPGAASAR